MPFILDRRLNDNYFEGGSFHQANGLNLFLSFNNSILRVYNPIDLIIERNLFRPITQIVSLGKRIALCFYGGDISVIKFTKKYDFVLEGIIYEDEVSLNSYIRKISDSDILVFYGPSKFRVVHLDENDDTKSTTEPGEALLTSKNEKENILQTDIAQNTEKTPQNKIEHSQGEKRDSFIIHERTEHFSKHQKAHIQFHLGIDVSTHANLIDVFFKLKTGTFLFHTISPTLNDIYDISVFENFLYILYCQAHRFMHVMIINLTNMQIIQDYPNVEGTKIVVFGKYIITVGKMVNLFLYQDLVFSTVLNIHFSILNSLVLGSDLILFTENEIFNIKIIKSNNKIENVKITRFCTFYGYSNIVFTAQNDKCIVLKTIKGTYALFEQKSIKHRKSVEEINFEDLNTRSDLINIKIRLNNEQDSEQKDENEYFETDHVTLSKIHSHESLGTPTYKYETSEEVFSVTESLIRRKKTYKLNVIFSLDHTRLINSGCVYEDLLFLNGNQEEIFRIEDKSLNRIEITERQIIEKTLLFFQYDNLYIKVTDKRINILNKKCLEIQIDDAHRNDEFLMVKKTNNDVLYFCLENIIDLAPILINNDVNLMFTCKNVCAFLYFTTFYRIDIFYKNLRLFSAELSDLPKIIYHNQKVNFQSSEISQSHSDTHSDSVKRSDGVDFCTIKSYTDSNNLMGVGHDFKHVITDQHGQNSRCLNNHPNLIKSYHNKSNEAFSKTNLNQSDYKQTPQLFIKIDQVIIYTTQASLNILIRCKNIIYLYTGVIKQNKCDFIRKTDVFFSRKMINSRDLIFFDNKKVLVKETGDMTSVDLDINLIIEANPYQDIRSGHILEQKQSDTFFAFKGNRCFYIKYEKKPLDYTQKIHKIRNIDKMVHDRRNNLFIFSFLPKSDLNSDFFYFNNQMTLQEIQYANERQEIILTTSNFNKLSSYLLPYNEFVSCLEILTLSDQNNDFAEFIVLGLSERCSDEILKGRIVIFEVIDVVSSGRKTNTTRNKPNISKAKEHFSKDKTTRDPVIVSNADQSSTAIKQLDISHKSEQTDIKHIPRDVTKGDTAEIRKVPCDIFKQGNTSLSDEFNCVSIDHCGKKHIIQNSSSIFQQNTEKELDLMRKKQKPISKTKKALKLLASEATKGTIQGISSVRGKMVVILATRMMVYEFDRNEGIQAIAFHDLNMFTTGLDVIKNYIVVCDLNMGLSLLYFQSEPVKIHPLGNSKSIKNLLNCSIFYSKNELFIACLDSLGSLYIYTYSPHNILSNKGLSLICRQKINTCLRYNKVRGNNQKTTVINADKNTSFNAGNIDKVRNIINTESTQHSGFIINAKDMSKLYATTESNASQNTRENIPGAPPLKYIKASSTVPQFTRLRFHSSQHFTLSLHSSQLCLEPLLELLHYYRSIKPSLGVNLLDLPNELLFKSCIDMEMLKEFQCESIGEQRRICEKIGLNSDMIVNIIQELKEEKT